MSARMKIAITLAYIPTALVLGVIVALLVMYLTGWRLWVIPPGIPETPEPSYRILTMESFRWN